MSLLFLTFLCLVVVLSDKRAACFALDGLLKSSRGWVVQQCEIDCCNATNCNSNPLLTQNATIVLQKDGNAISIIFWFVSFSFKCTILHDVTDRKYILNDNCNI